MSKKATIIAVVNQKGGTGKTTTTENLGVGLALEGKKVLLVDTDPQASLTVSLGNPCPDDLSPTLSDLMGKIMMENPITPDEGILHHPEGVDLVPSNIELSGMEVALVNAMSRETILRQYLDTVMRYLQYSTLQQKNLTHFDSWASTFGETTTAIELAPEGTGYRARTRFAKFFNLPELMNMFKEVADIKTSDQLHLPVPEAKFETVVVQPSEYQKDNSVSSRYHFRVFSAL